MTAPSGDGAARNVEVKLPLNAPHTLDAVQAHAKALADGEPQTLQQDDTFYAAPTGRLKLRRFGDGTAELIAYQRADQAGPKLSSYRVVPVADADALHEALALVMLVLGRVRKQRLLLRVGRTRVHLDRVEGLGDFLELEVVLRPGEPVADGEAEARALLQALGLGHVAQETGAYLDLLRATAGGGEMPDEGTAVHRKAGPEPA